jgi:phospholipid transport system substrate-binding protein
MSIVSFSLSANTPKNSLSSTERPLTEQLIPLNIQTTSRIDLSPESFFKTKIKALNHFLLLNKKTIKNNSIEQKQLMKQYLFPLWNIPYMIKRLLGRSIWNKLSSQQKKKLIITFKHTFTRYVHEGLQYYNGQTIRYHSIKTNTKGKGYLSLHIVANWLPTFNVHFKLFKKDEHWKLYDILIQGISYVAMKKRNLRFLYRTQGFLRLLHYLNLKNHPLKK